VALIQIGKDMKIALSLSIYAAAIAMGTSSYGQDKAMNEDTKCWFASGSFTEGALIAQGNKLMRCGADRQWMQTSEEDASSSCLYENKFYGTGSAVAVNKDKVLRCESTGIWIDWP
jgi:hypothetical protein